jgi:N-acetylmuramoyl-L-alanine amidase
VTDHHQSGQAPRPRSVLVLVVIAVGVLTSACGASGGPAAAAGTHPAATGASPSASPPTSPPASPRPGTAHSKGPGPGRPAAAARPLAGKIVGIDPGHNGGNFTDPAYIDHLIWNGREWETCNTTGTETDGGYTEARFNFRVAMFLRADLRRAGARVVITRTNNHGVGPCVNRRAAIINRGHPDVAIDIHADGAPAPGRGFAVLEPGSDGPNDKVITSSERFGNDVRRALLAGTSMPESTYDGVRGIKHRDDLAGLNLTRVPEVLIECGNMRNSTDARLLTSAEFQRRIASALEAAIIRFLHKG